MTTYYQILELPEQASPADIRRAYLQLVRVTHPDRTPDPLAHRRYLLVNEAYDTLRQPELRARYDAQLATARQPPRPAAPTFSRPFGGNAYQVLRVPYSATPAQIEQAYQRLRQRLGLVPTDPGLRAYLHQVEHAYATLTSPLLRPAHDARVRGQRPQPAADAYAPVYARLAPYARQVCRVLMAFFLLLLLDRNLTLTFPNESVQEVQLDLQNNRFCCQVRTPNARFRIHSIDMAKQFDVERSALFRQVRSYRPRPAGGGLGEAVDYTPETIYGFVFFLPVIMGICGLTGSQRRSPNAVVVNCAVAGSVVSLIVLFLLVAA